MPATEHDPEKFRSEVELPRADLSHETEQLAAAVREAGLLALSMFGKPIKTWTKGPTLSPVSEADIAADNLLRDRKSVV